MVILSSTFSWLSYLLFWWLCLWFSLFVKNIQLANYTYLAYVFVAIVGSIYNFIGVQDAVLLFTDPNIRMGAELGAKGSAIFGIVLNVIFLAIVFYKMWRQQKELTETQEEEELA